MDGKKSENLWEWRYKLEGVLRIKAHLREKIFKRRNLTNYKFFAISLPCWINLRYLHDEFESTLATVCCSKTKLHQPNIKYKSSCFAFEPSKLNIFESAHAKFTNPHLSVSQNRHHHHQHSNCQSLKCK